MIFCSRVGNISIEKFEVTPVVQNCRILSTEGKAVVIDPGGDADLIIRKLEEKKLVLEEIWLTHSHFDHCGGVQPIKKRFNGVILKGHLLEKEFRANAGDIAQSWGIPGITSCPEPDEYLNDGDQFDWKGIRISVLFTPGHSPGHLCYYLPEIGVLFCGDTVFSGSIGRTDLPGGNFELLIRSIKDKILILPNETRLLPGHGPDTTVEREKFSNPFLKQ